MDSILIGLPVVSCRRKVLPLKLFSLSLSPSLSLFHLFLNTKVFYSYIFLFLNLFFPFSPLNRSLHLQINSGRPLIITHTENKLLCILYTTTTLPSVPQNKLHMILVQQNRIYMNTILNTDIKQVHFHVDL